MRHGRTARQRCARVSDRVCPRYGVSSQVDTPFPGSRTEISVHSGDGGPLLPVGLSGLRLSRHIGLHTWRFVSGVSRHEQLVCSTSRTPLMVTLVVAPSRLCPCAVASMLKPFSAADVRTSPGFRLDGF